MMTIKTIVWLVYILSVDPKPVFGLVDIYEDNVTCEAVRAEARKVAPEEANRTMCVQVVVPQMI